MEDLKSRIVKLQQKAQSLEPTPAERQALLIELQQYSEDFLTHLPSEKAYTPGRPEKSAFSLKGEPTPFKDVLEIYSGEVAAHGVKPASGGHMGYIPGGGLYASALADFLVDITNEYAGISFASPGAVAMEHALLDWMKGLFHFPDSAVGNLTSGGSIANQIALTAARDKHKIKGREVEKGVVYMSPHLHHCNHKALRIIGLEDVIIRELELDQNFRIIPGDLKYKIKKDKEAGLKPFLIIASAGTTDTGAVDPLQEIGKISAEENLWFHVDAAYGGFFILTEKCKELFSGIELADSLAVDPHKGLFLPFGLGAVLVKDREAVFHSHHHAANYMQDALENAQAIDPADVSPELTKHFRAFRMWLPLQLYGIDPFTACLNEKLLLTQYFREQLIQSGFKVGPEPDLTVSYFWWPLEVGDENEFNKRLMKKIHSDGSVFLTSTIINGKFVIRLAILSFRTRIETVDKAIFLLNKCCKELVSQLYN